MMGDIANRDGSQLGANAKDPGWREGGPAVTEMVLLQEPRLRLGGKGQQV